MMATNKNFEVLEVGIFTPKETCRYLRPGEVGYMVANIKNTADVKIGDTITLQKNPAQEALAWLSLSPLWFLQGSIRSIPPISRRCAMLWSNCSSTTLPSILNRRAAWPSDLASAAAF